MELLLLIFAVGCYILAGSMQALGLYGYLERNQFALVFAAIAVVCHAILLHQMIDTGAGQNLTVFNMASQILWVIAVLVLLLACFKAVTNLGAFIFPLAALSLILAKLFPSERLINTAADPKQLVHILMSFLAVGIFCLATIQAFYVAIQSRLLKLRQTSGIVKALPPLESSERLLFQLITVGFLVLTVMLVSSIIFYPNIFNRGLIQHTFFALLAWVVFATLLWGRYYLGWRGNKAITWTLSGFVLLLLSYLFSHYLFR